MFWKRFDIQDSYEERDDLRQALADRLRVALDFATLGAYELSGPDEATEGTHRDATSLRETEQPARRSCQSVAHRRHVTAANLPCPAPEHARTAEAACERSPRRGGSVAGPQQPCTWAES
jgi:hypothetical protein